MGSDIKYIISQSHLGSPGDVEITKEDFELYRRSKIFQKITLDIEERFDIVMENYGELEVDVLKTVSKNLIFSNGDFDSWADERIMFNRRIMNLLSSTKSYFDQTQKDVSSFFGKQSREFGVVTAAFSEQYDLSYGYRVLEALRNYAQHSAIPVHWMGHSDKYVHNTGKHFASVSVSVDISKLRKDKKLKKRPVFAEIEERESGTINLMPHVRGYVAGIGAAQNRIRECLELGQKDAVRVENEARQRFVEKFGESENPVYLMSVTQAWGGGNGVEAEHTLMGALNRHRERLIRKNPGDIDFRTRCVTSHP